MVLTRAKSRQSFGGNFTVEEEFVTTPKKSSRNNSNTPATLEKRKTPARKRTLEATKPSAADDNLDSVTTSTEQEDDHIISNTTTFINEKETKLSSSLSNELTQATFWLQNGHHSSAIDCVRFPYIDYGYRTTRTVYDTFFTLFSLHNESMNIWSHLIGFICVVFAGISISIDLFQSSERSVLELFAVESYIVCAAICLLLSSIYHWFGMLSQECHDCLLRFDWNFFACSVLWYDIIVICS